MADCGQLARATSLRAAMEYLLHFAGHCLKAVVVVAAAAAVAVAVAAVAVAVAADDDDGHFVGVAIGLAVAMYCSDCWSCCCSRSSY